MSGKTLVAHILSGALVAFELWVRMLVNVSIRVRHNVVYGEVSFPREHT